MQLLSFRVRSTPAGLWRGWQLAPHLLGATLFLALYAAATFVPASQRLLGGLAYHVPPLIALSLLPSVIRRTAGRERAGWVLLALVLVAWDAAEWVYSYETLVNNGELPIPSIADWLYYAGYAAFIAALPVLAGGNRRLGDPRLLLDAAVIATVLGVLSWYFILRSLLPSTDPSLAEFVLFGYPLLDLGLAAALLAAFYGSPVSFGPPMRWLLAAVIILQVTDTVYFLTASETVAQASLLDVGWLASYLCMGGALRSRLRESAEPVKTRQPGESSLALALPYIALIPLAATTAWHTATVQPGGYLAAGTACAAILVMARQLLTLLDNRRLYRVLEAKAQESAEQAAAVERLRQQAAFLADHDELTGLLSRRAWLAAARDHRTGSIALFDVDHFKRINDRYGHVQGDRVLQLVADRLKALIGEAGVVGRVGGEEFAVVFTIDALPALTSCGDVVEKFSRQPLMECEGEEPLLVTLSAGIAHRMEFEDLETSLTATYEHADRALYLAKQRGRSRVVPAVHLAA